MSNPWDINSQGADPGLGGQTNYNQVGGGTSGDMSDVINYANSSASLQGNDGSTQPQKDMTGSAIVAGGQIAADAIGGVLQNQAIDNAKKDAIAMSELEDQDIEKQNQFDNKVTQRKMAMAEQLQKQQEQEYKLELKYNTWLAACKKEISNAEKRRGFIDKIRTSFQTNQSLANATTQLWKVKK
jgi:hypothetical protein